MSRNTLGSSLVLISEMADVVSFAGRFGIVLSRGNLDQRSPGASESRYKQVNRMRESGVVHGSEQYN